MKRTRNLKLPNGFGSVIYLGDKRRRPYAALKTMGWDENKRQIKKYIGYETTYNKAYQLLLDYNGTPYNLDYKNLTIGECYDKLLPILQNSIGKPGMSKSNFNNLISAYNNHLVNVADIPILSVKKKDVQNIMDNSSLGHTSKGYIKNIFSRIIIYGIDELELPIDRNICDLNVGEKEKSNLHIPFTLDEIKKIEELTNEFDIAKMIMIYFYTGLRPSELLEIKIENIFLDENYMIGGLKTEAGTNRIIPINSKIKKFIEYFYTQDNEYLIINKNSNSKMTYDTYQKRFSDLMGSFSFNHTPHDTRHTFATKCDDLNIPLPIIKILMGHSLANDVTNNVYIHTDKEKLLSYIEKIEYK